MSSESFLQRRLEREKAARKEAENLLESKSAELFKTNENLLAARAELEEKINARTRELQRTVNSLESEIAIRKDMEYQLRLSRASALELAEMKSQFLARMSHEIRTPLNAIIGLTEVVLNSDLTEEQDRQLETIQSSSNLLLRIINDVLDISKLDANKVELNYQATSIEALITQAVDLMTNTAAEKEIDINLINQSDSPHEVLIDSGRIHQILLNLLSNAVKYSESGTITVLWQIDYPSASTASIPKSLDSLLSSRESVPGELRLTVRDEGLGIRATDLDSLFDPFTKLAVSNEGSSGLGLSICKRLTDLMGGNILAKSTYGEGSEFTLTVPCALASMPAKQSKENAFTHPEQADVLVLDEASQLVAARPGTKVNMSMGIEKPMTILVADDNEVNRMVQQTQLEQLGYRADVVTNGEEVLRALRVRSYDVILLDILMPVLDGIETTRSIRQSFSGRQPYIVAVTASALEGDRLKFIEAGVDAYLAKPVTFDGLTETLSSAFEIKTQQSNSVSQGNPAFPHGITLQLDDVRERLGPAADDLLRQVIPVFIREMPAREKGLREAFDKQDPVSFARLCHSLKGSSRSIGALKLASACEGLERESYNEALPKPGEFEAMLDLARATVHSFEQELTRLTA